MRLLEFNPRGYRGLPDLPIYFSFDEQERTGQDCSIRFLTGVNGTGKTTLLRFLAAIFAAIEEGYQQERAGNPAYGADFSLRYQLRNDTIEISKTGHGRAGLQFKINGEQTEGIPGGDQVLPQALLIYTSGDIGAWQTLLSPPLVTTPETAEVLPKLLRLDEEEGAGDPAALPSEEEIRLTPAPSDELIQRAGRLNRQSEALHKDAGDVFSRVTLVQPTHLPLAFLVACLLQTAEQEQQTPIGADFQTVLDHVRIDRLTNVSLRLRYNPALLSEAQRRRLHRLADAATLTLNQSDTWLWIYDVDDREQGQGPASKLMPDLRLNPGQPYQLFQDLVRLYEEGRQAVQIAPEARPFELLEVNLIVHKLLPGQTGKRKLLLFSDLSDGERAYLSRMALIHLLGKQESLFLLDEPETHFNDSWKRSLVEQIEKTLSGSGSAVILTTHASIVLTDAYPEEIVLLGEDGQQSVPLTFAAEQNELLRSVFGADRSVGRRAMERVKQAIENGTAEDLETLLDQVGPGYFRFKLIEALERRRVSPDQSS